MQKTAEPSAGAVSHISTDWHAIPWKTVNETVRRLQARIVQATKAGKWHKVHALQHLLTHSLSGKALAVRRVTENQGKNTPGVDNVTWQDPEGLDHGIGHFMLFEVDSEAQAPAPPMPKSPQTSSAASDRKSAPQPWFRQAG